MLVALSVELLVNITTEHATDSEKLTSIKHDESQQ